MPVSVQTTGNAITLKGSVSLVTDYLKFGINSILYQRAIYPPETFTPANHFGLSIYMSTDNKIHQFLESVLGQIKAWIVAEKVKKISLVITNIMTKEVLEKWDFKLSYDGPKGGEGETKDDVLGTKDLSTIQKEIRDVLIQICSTVSFLPLLDSPCSFDILSYTDPQTDVPKDWTEAGPCFIANSEELQLHCFSTSFHKMDTVVSFKAS